MHKRKSKEGEMFLIEIYVVCFCGLGSATLLQLGVKKVLDRKKIRGEVTVFGTTDLPAGGKLPALVVTMPEIYEHLSKRPEFASLFNSTPKRVVAVKNYADVEGLYNAISPILDVIVKEQQ